MKRSALLTAALCVTALSVRAETLVLDINVFQAFRSNSSPGETSPPNVVVLPPDQGWSDQIERQREQIATALGFEGVAIVAKERAAVTEGATHRFEAGKDWRFPYQIAVRAQRGGVDRAEVGIRILQKDSSEKEVASASISGELGKTFILAGDAGGTSLLVAVTPRRATAAGETQDIRTVGGEVRAPRLLNQIAPNYPDSARKQKVTGQVIIQAVIEKDGTVARASVVRPVHPDLDAAALEAVRRWRYEPARQGGKPVAVYMTISMDFRLK